jgi:VWFA-related protein
MKHKSGPTSHFVTLVVSLACIAPVVPTWAQTDAQETRPFGSSLRRPKASTAGRLNRDADHKAGEDEASEEIIRVDTSLVLLDVLVTDGSGTKPITGLTRDDFIVAEDARTQEVSFFAPGDDAQRLPRSIVLVFDRSDSQLAYIEASVEAAKKLVGRLAPTDEMAIVTDDVHLAMGFTKDKKQLKRTLDSLKEWTLKGYRTRSMQFSALLATLRELIDAGKRRPIIILQTDGDEVGRLSGWPPVAGERPEAPGYDMSDVYAEAERSRAKIYAVVPNERLLGLSEQEAEGRARLTLEKQQAARLKNQDMWHGLRRLPPEKATAPAPTAFNNEALLGRLRELREKWDKRAVETLVQGQIAAARIAELTGGWASFLGKPEDADAVYGRILADINSRYVIGYYPSNKQPDGKLRQIKVEVRGHPDYVVQGRRSYFPRPR